MKALAATVGVASALAGWVTFALGAVHLWVALYATGCLLGQLALIGWWPR